MARVIYENEITSLRDLAVGKRIRCHYKVDMAGKLGLFSGLGEETSDFIPPFSSDIPDGDFFFICTGKDYLGRWILIADRNIQHSISWVTLNNLGIASYEGVDGKTFFSSLPASAASYGFTLRLINTGKSLVEYDEWRDFVVRNNLNNTISPGDDTIWHWNTTVSSWTLATISDAGKRGVRGYENNISFLDEKFAETADPTVGFRPVLLISVFAAPPEFSGGLDKTKVHSEDVVLSGTITHKYKNKVRYRVIVNGVQLYPQDGFTAYSPTPLPVQITIPNSTLKAGENRIALDMEDTGEYKQVWLGSVILESEAPVITASMIGMKLDATITDPELDPVQFKVLLDGIKIYPTDAEWTPLLPSGAKYSKLFTTNEAPLNTPHIVTIIAKDAYGIESKIDYGFIGDYAGLMFVDELNRYYSDDIGTILQYLDIGTITQGQTSETFTVKLVNKTGETLKNIQLTVDQTNVPSGTMIYISKTQNPFEPAQTLIFDGPMQHGDYVKFYVVAKADKTATLGPGQFKVLVRGEPI